MPIEPTPSCPSPSRMLGPARLEAIRRARAFLSRLVEPPAPATAAMIAAFGPLETAERVRAGRDVLPEAVAAETSARTDQYRAVQYLADRDLADITGRGGRLLIPEDPDWPTEAFADFPVPAPSATRGHTRSTGGVDTTRGASPDLVAPLALWMIGSLPPDRACGPRARAVALTGARAASHYGLHIARDWGAELGAAGVTVVAGAALGVDQAAHRGALAAGGPTVAVLPCALDRSHPPANAGMIARIADHGVVLTEYPPGVTPSQTRLHARLRLIAALAPLTVIVEAGVRSRALVLAEVSRSLGRVVMAVPGPVTSTLSAGTHELARNPATVLAATVAHVLQELPDPGPATLA